MTESTIDHEASETKGMAHNITLITTISASLAYVITGFLAARPKLPALLGYLIPWILIGPATREFVADVELANQLADIA